jgi:hypothetical protein
MGPRRSSAGANLAYGPGFYTLRTPCPGAVWYENAALHEAAFGNAGDAKPAAMLGLTLAPTSQAVGVETALAYALAGDTVRAESLAQDLNKRFPLDTQVQSLWLPAVRAQVALDRKNPGAALQSLEAAVPIESDRSRSSPIFPASIQLIFVDRFIWRRDRERQLPRSSRKSSIIAASFGIAGLVL